MNKYTTILLISTMLTFCLQLGAQVLPTLNIDVKVDDEILKNPFVGGVNSPQTYNIDLNLDGVEDILMFDRDGDVVIPYIMDNATNQFVYAPEYADNFGVVREWMVIRDYDNDGLDDMFTLVTALPGIFVKKGVEIDGQLHMVDVELGNANNILYASQLGTFTNIQVNFGDQPEILDFDGDGDVDVLNFEGNGSYLWYYKNYAVERGLAADAFDFELDETCWGKIYESSFSQELLLSSDGVDCASALQEHGQGGSSRHSGSTVTAFDEDGDGDMDVILGDLENNNITFLRNDSSNGSSWVTELDYSYPSYDVPADITLFDAAFYTDVSNDGKRDLLVSPNLEGGFENHNCVWYYENVNTDENPTFEFRSKKRFVEDMIDLGSDTSPAIADVNGDGLLDIVVGTSGEYQIDNNTDARLVLYTNVGTAVTPAYELTDDNYLSFRAFNTAAAPSRSFSPAFGDLDSDGDIDLLVGDNNGYLYYLENNAGSDVAFTFEPAIYKYQDIRPGGNAKPLIYDLDGNGLNDIIIGENNGNADGMGLIASVNFYGNIGSVGNPSFNSDDTDPVNNQFIGEINPFVTGYNRRSAAPTIAYTDSDPILFVGSEGGVLFAFENFDGVMTGPFDTYDFNFSDLNIGSKVTPAFADLNSDGLLDLVIGNQRGGIQIFETNIPSGTTSTKDIVHTNQFSIMPNPTSDNFKIIGLEISNIQLSIIDMNGQVIRYLNLANSSDQVEISDLSSGIYLVQATSGEITYTSKLVKL